MERDAELRVLVLGPTLRDGSLTCRILREAGIAAVALRDVRALAEELERGAGAALLPVERLDAEVRTWLAGHRRREPPWSDLPLLLIAPAQRGTSAMTRLLDEVPGTVSVIPRPVGVVALVSAVRAALSGRRRQYELRDHLRARDRVEEELEELVAERTEELRGANAELRQRAAMLQRLALELTRVEHQERRRLAQLLHDQLQQLLVAAQFQLGVAERRTGDPAAGAAALDQIRDHLGESIRMSRSLATQLSPPVLDRVGLGAALQRLVEWFSEQHGLAVELDLEPGAEPEGAELRGIAYGAVRELLLNVAKHAGTGEVSLRVRLGGEGRVVAIVRDEGRGFDVAAAARSAEASGGFGLMSIRERLEALGGRLGVESTPGGGTTCTLEIPRAPAGPDAAGLDGDGAGDAEDPSSDDGLAVTSAILRPLRVLVADDHRIMREGLAGLLAMDPGLEVVGEAEDGYRAVELALQRDPDVVLMDVSMPGIDGIEATRRIKEQRPEVQVIGLSMHEDAEVARAMIDAGAARYMTKDGPSEVLVQTILEARPGPPGPAAP